MSLADKLQGIKSRAPLAEKLAAKKGQKLKAGSLKGGKDEPSAKAPAGSGKRFAALKAKLSKRKGVKDPGALAAAIGRAKFGKGKFQAMAKKGSAKEEDNGKENGKENGDEKKMSSKERFLAMIKAKKAGKKPEKEEKGEKEEKEEETEKKAIGLGGMVTLPLAAYGGYKLAKGLFGKKKKKPEVPQTQAAQMPKTAAVPEILATLAPYLIGGGIGAAGTGGAAYMLAKKRGKEHTAALEAEKGKRKVQLQHLAGLFRKANMAENQALARRYYQLGRTSAGGRQAYLNALKGRERQKTAGPLGWAGTKAMQGAAWGAALPVRAAIGLGTLPVRVARRAGKSLVGQAKSAVTGKS